MVQFLLYWTTVIVALVIYACMVFYLQLRPAESEPVPGQMTDDPLPTSSLLNPEKTNTPENKGEDWQKEWKDQIARLDLSPERKDILLQKLMNSQRFSNKGEQ